MVELSQLVSPRERLFPWSVPGTQDISTASTVDEALAMAKLDWKVEQTPVYQKRPGDRKFRPVKNRVFNERVTDGEVLGIVTPSYHVVQQTDAFAFAQEMLDEGIKPLQGGQLEGGKLVFLVFELPDTIDVGPDVLRPYLLIQNAHDGYRTLTASVQVVRIACTNQLSPNLPGALSSWKVKHTAYLANKVQTARQQLDIAGTYISYFERETEKLLRVKLNPLTAEELLRKVFPVSPTATEAQLERSQLYGAIEVWRASETIPDNIRMTLWGLLNGVTEFVDFASSYRSQTMSVEDSRAESILFGPASWKKQRAFDVLSEFAAEQSKN